MSQVNATGWFMSEPGKPLVKKEFTIDAPGAEEAIVKVAGCGLCHTDLTFLSGSVKTKYSQPLVLGHEISGTVVAAGSAVSVLSGKKVIIPAVLPCGECELCRAGRDNICQAQKMPGNDFHGGFATHIKVPARFLCELPDALGAYKLEDLSVIADAVTTPYQSLVRSRLEKGDLALVIGTGGIGIYMVQHARNAGAIVIAIDVDDGKLEQAKKMGATFVVNARSLDQKALKNQIRSIVADNNLPKHKWKIFETSGTAVGQDNAFNLMTFASTVGMVGFTMDKLNVRLSNLMAFDADLFGNWGCRPALYAPVVKDVIAGRVNLQENIEKFPLSEINDVIEASKSHKLKKRAIFVP